MNIPLSPLLSRAFAELVSASVAAGIPAERWQLYRERDGSVWVAHGDGRHARRALRDSSRWAARREAAMGGTRSTRAARAARRGRHAAPRHWASRIAPDTATAVAVMTEQTRKLQDWSKAS